ncbi:MAG: metal-dependent hydrolase [Acidobacteria bacterium RIFCSPLOWO2_12_FULL_66_10]|nr:MAG: metal-dependent hydrolase [Acidobacteria bacterium RIFCSPLOWO2_12_FULL_66_10]
MRTFVIAVAVITLAGLAMLGGQPALPVIDVHLHALPADAQGPPPLAMCTPIPAWPAWDPVRPYQLTVLDPKQPGCADPIRSPMTDQEVMTQTIAAAERRNIFGVLSGTPERVDTWRRAAPGRFLPGVLLRLGDKNAPTVAALRELHAKGRLAVLGEVINQYAGIPPDDPQMEPYWAMAEALDIPAGIHIGPGPPGVIYLGATGYRARLHSALTLEEVLVRHPRLRLYIMHAGYPMLDDVLAVLYAHPQVHLDTGVIVFTESRPAFYRYLQAIVEAGFANRVMFGSDQMVWPGVIERAIETIESAPFLSEQQKRNILYNNAARFLRLGEAEIAKHHGR